MIFVNRTDWPTPAVRILARWVCVRAKIRGRYRVTLSNKRGRWCGRGAPTWQRVYLSRRFKPFGGWPYDVADHRIPGAPVHQLRSRLELLVYILAHEAYHANAGQRKEYRRTGGRVDVQSMEYDCNKFAWEVVNLLRESWSELRVKIMAAMRATRGAPDTRIAKKLEAAQKLLCVWERKAKLAATKCKKYRRAVRRHESRAAAFGGGKVD